MKSSVCINSNISHWTLVRQCLIVDLGIWRDHLKLTTESSQDSKFPLVHWSVTSKMSYGSVEIPIHWSFRPLIFTKSVCCFLTHVHWCPFCLVSQWKCLKVDQTHPGQRGKKLWYFRGWGVGYCSSLWVFLCLAVFISRHFWLLATWFEVSLLKDFCVHQEGRFSPQGETA